MSVALSDKIRAWESAVTDKTGKWTGLVSELRTLNQERTEINNKSIYYRKKLEDLKSSTKTGIEVSWWCYEVKDSQITNGSSFTQPVTVSGGIEIQGGITWTVKNAQGVTEKWTLLPPDNDIGGPVTAARILSQ
jgi:hypothetical protein